MTEHKYTTEALDTLNKYIDCLQTRNTELLDALEGLLTHLWDGRKRDVKQDYSLMVAEVTAQEAIRKATLTSS